MGRSHIRSSSWRLNLSHPPRRRKRLRPSRRRRQLLPLLLHPSLSARKLRLLLPRLPLREPLPHLRLPLLKLLLLKLPLLRPPSLRPRNPQPREPPNLRPSPRRLLSQRPRQQRPRVLRKSLLVRSPRASRCTRRFQPSERLSRESMAHARGRSALLCSSAGPRPSALRATPSILGSRRLPAARWMLTTSSSTRSQLNLRKKDRRQQHACVHRAHALQQ